MLKVVIVPGPTLRGPRDFGEKGSLRVVCHFPVPVTLTGKPRSTCTRLRVVIQSLSVDLKARRFTRGVGETERSFGGTVRRPMEAAAEGYGLWTLSALKARGKPPQLGPSASIKAWWIDHEVEVVVNENNGTATDGHNINGSDGAISGLSVAKGIGVHPQFDVSAGEGGRNHDVFIFWVRGRSPTFHDAQMGARSGFNVRSAVLRRAGGCDPRHRQTKDTQTALRMTRHERQASQGPFRR